jgi:hypothetical protein
MAMLAEKPALLLPSASSSHAPCRPGFRSTGASGVSWAPSHWYCSFQGPLTPGYYEKGAMGAPGITLRATAGPWEH